MRSVGRGQTSREKEKKALEPRLKQSSDNAAACAKCGFSTFSMRQYLHTLYQQFNFELAESSARGNEGWKDEPTFQDTHA